jgi:hypothetical protein
MFIDFQEIQAIGASQFEAASTATAATARGLQTISTEAAEFARKRVERGFAFGESLLRARKLDEVVQLQSDFARDAYDDLISQAGRFGSIFSDLAKEAFSPKKGAAAASVVATRSAASAAAQPAKG